MNITVRNYLIMFLLLGVSGMPFFSGKDIFIIAIAGLLLLFAVIDRDIVPNREFVIILGTMLMLVLLQAFIFSFFKLATVIGLVLKLLIAYLSVKLLKEQFINYFLNTMVFLTLVSFLFFIPIYLRPGLEDMFLGMIPSILSYEYYQMGVGYVYKPTLILYEFNTRMIGNFGLIVRNCGPFWEPGAFGGYLIIALIFNTIRERKFSTRINWLFIIAILSTQSTTAFMALFAFILIVYLIFQKYTLSFKLLIVAALALAVVVAFQKINFLQAKIKIEMEGLKDAMDAGGDTRMASAALDWQDVKQFPFTGRGMWNETRIDERFESVMRNNGFTNLVARWGLPFFFLFFYWYYKGFKAYCRVYGANVYMPLAVLGMFWLIGMSQDYFESPFFLSMAFLFTPYRNTELMEVVEVPEAAIADYVS